MINKIILKEKSKEFRGYLNSIGSMEDKIGERISEILVYLCDKFDYKLDWWDYDSNSSKTFFNSYKEGDKEIKIYVEYLKSGSLMPQYKYPDGATLSLSDETIPLFWIFDDCDYKLEIDNIYNYMIDEKNKKLQKAKAKREADKQKKSEAKLLESEWKKLSLDERKKLLNK